MSFFKTGIRPFVIAGPCSAETREQVLETAAALKKISESGIGVPVQLFRAGIWKPRTKPGSFEGIGTKGLGWLKEVKEQYQMPVTVEVAEPQHIEEALKYGIDVLWIGARTTVNPFQVQRLADALKGVDIPVMIKNPVNPDVDLWEGAIERFERSGIKDISAIHRGFSSYDKTAVYRNEPNWPIPIELKRRKPGLPVFCDPSHITGKRERIAEIAQKAMDMDFDGLMIETHPRPTEAWSDAAQQVTPDTLRYILRHLVVRKEYVGNMGLTMEMDYLRQLMDSLDAEIIDLIARRMELSEKMGEVKRSHNITAYQPERWREIVESRSARALSHNLSKEFILKLYELIHHESIKKQLAILQDLSKEVNGEK